MLDIGQQNKKKHRFKSAVLDNLNYSNDNESNTIIEFDDESSEVSNLNTHHKEEEESNFNENCVDEFEEKINYITKRNIVEESKIDNNLKKLMEMDTKDKKGIINILMKEDLIQLNPELIKEKNKKKYKFVHSKNKSVNLIRKGSLDKKSNIQIEPKEKLQKNLKNSNSTAQITKSQIQKNEEKIAKILFEDIPSQNTRKRITTEEIGEKIKKVLDKKRRNLERIEQEIYEKQCEENTFNPSINHRKNEKQRRNLDIFLQDQNNFQKKVEQKRKNLLKRSESERRELNVGKPFINKNSVEIARKLNNDDENVYLRLYNKKNKDKDKEIESKLKISEAEKKPPIKKLKKNRYSYVKSKIKIDNNYCNNSKQMNKVEIKEKNFKTEKNNKILRKKSNTEIVLNEKNKILDIKDLQSNKIIWKKFYNNLDKALKKINITKYEDDIDLEKNQYYTLLYNLGMVTYDPENKDKDKSFNHTSRTTKEKNSDTCLDNTIRLEEKSLVDNSYNLLKVTNENGKIKLSDMKIFLIFVLNLQNYEFYHKFKLNNNPDKIKELFPSENFKKEDIPELIIKKQNEIYLSEIDKSNIKNCKYYYISKSNKIIFTLENSSYIRKDFNVLSINYRNHKDKQDESKLKIDDELFKPKINLKSQKIYQNYKNRINKIYMSTNDTNSTNSQNRKSNLEYFDRILLLDKKRIAQNQKIKEELEKKEKKECTFRPKINLPKKPRVGGDIKNVNRVDELYEHGKQTMKLKRDKKKEEIEFEHQINECTFQPDIYTLIKQKIPYTKFQNDIYNEKEYQVQYERLKQGRLERMVKENKNNRYGLNNELKQFVKDIKEYNYIQKESYFDKSDPYSNNVINSNIKLEEEDNELNFFGDENDKESNNDNDNDKNKIINDNMPLLIIDVNIREGLKKKLYVFEGDTPETLAEKFAQENNLDIETQNKLQKLIKSHMIKLLTKIDEENKSASENSQNIKNKINN